LDSPEGNIWLPGIELPRIVDSDDAEMTGCSEGQMKIEGSLFQWVIGSRRFRPS
jgi:hypothetical protein